MVLSPRAKQITNGLLYILIAIACLTLRITASYIDESFVAIGNCCLIAMIPLFVLGIADIMGLRSPLIDE